ncbi:MAG: hypothetical protein JOY80_06570, partial [Candidatus Dormibacteraeota bacterium]|nr:hypothetical protein [Candidatus Dormibacteraeota bacterium]
MTTIAFHRVPRTRPPVVPSDPVVIRTPPPLDESGRLLRTLQIVAPVTAAGTGLVFVLAYRQSAPLIIAMGIAIGTAVIVAMLTAFAQARATRRQRRRARRRYLDYLAAMQADIDSLLTLQLQREATLFPTASQMLDLAIAGQRLFERRATDDDFLDVRVGTGPLPWPAPVVLQEVDPLGPELETDLLGAAQQLVARYAQRDSGPHAISLKTSGTVAVRGQLQTGRGVVRSVVLQAALFQSPDDLRIAVLCDSPSAAAEWDWIKWLPHAHAGDAVTDTMCADASAADSLLRRLGATRGPAHTLLVVDCWSPRGPLARSAELRAAMAANGEARLTTLCLVERDQDEPADVRSRVVVDGSRITPDDPEPPIAVAIARRLAPLRLERQSSEVAAGESSAGGLAVALGR